jgi:aminoglycoside N3'-acetyltransferase
MSGVTTIDRLTAQLADLGVEHEDTVMVHASLRAIGPVEGGAAGLIAALDRAVGPQGSLLMVLGARDDWAWVNDLPEEERADLLADAEPFEALRTPAEPDVGTLAEVFRTHPGTRVSDHPEGRFAARGRLAETLTAEPPWDDYFGPGSPLARLLAAHGKVLRLGADPDTVTLLHHAEYLAPLPVKRRVRRHRLVVGPSGPELRVVECLDDSNGIVDRLGEDYFTTILRSYLALGAHRCGTVGNAVSELIDGRHLVGFAVDWMSEHL